jgi:hypothetical protein
MDRWPTPVLVSLVIVLNRDLIGMTALPEERSPILIDRSLDWLSAARLQPAGSPARLCLAQQVQELPGRHEPHALMLFDV